MDSCALNQKNPSSNLCLVGLTRADSSIYFCLSNPRRVLRQVIATFFLRQAGRATRKRKRPAYFFAVTPGAYTEDVLTYEQVEQFRVLLEELRGELRAGLERGAEDVAPVSPDAAIGRLTRQDAMQAQQMALALRRRTQVRLQQVESALDRVDKGEFGLCVRCEEEIAPARLRVRPEAPLCLNCAEKRG